MDESAGDGLGGLSGNKPVQSLDWIISNFARSNALWPQGSVIQYSFRESRPAGAESEIDFGAFTEIQRQFTRMGFDLISDVANLTFIEVPDDGRATSNSSRIYFGGDTSTGPDDEGVWGYAQRWGVGSRITSAEVWTFTEAVNTRQWIVGGYNFQATMHEQLHTLGVPHPGSYNAGGEDAPPITYAANAEYAQDSRQFTIMSYFAASNTGSDHLFESQDDGLYSGATPLLHDVAALQAMYGANMSTRTGDTVYGYNSNTGRPSLSIAPGSTVADATVNSAPIFTIWDAGGVDLLNLSLTTFAATLDLKAGAFSDAFQMTNNISIAYGVTIENASTGSGNDRIVGNEVGNHLTSGAGDDQLFGAGGNDFLEGGSGQDRLHGEAGDDLFGGQDGNDYVNGGAGRDSAFGDSGDDFLEGGFDDDRLFGQDGDDLIGAQEGADYLSGGGGRDSLYGDAGNDFLEGGLDDDRLFGQDGDDLMGAQEGADYLNGGGGRDALYGDAGNDFLEGGLDDDRLYGQDGDDLIGAQEGADYLSGGGGRDALFGDAGNDFLEGGGENDGLYGQDGDDVIGGQDGDDVIDGGIGRDALYGDGGDDLLFGGEGGDVLLGQAGADRFVFTGISQSGGEQRDRIVDFDAAAGDRIDVAGIDADVFAAGDQAFSFVGGFSGRAGEAVLSFDQASNTTTLSLDVNGDGQADFRLDINGQAAPGPGFVL